MDRKPTQEQQAIITAALTGGNLVIQAGAGTGKTSTIEMLAQALPKRGIYLAYGRKAADDAKIKFAPYPHVTPLTTHSLALRAMGGYGKYKARLQAPRMPAKQFATLLGSSELKFNNDLELNAQQVARIAKDTVRKFCESADLVIEGRHVPYQNGITAPDHRARLTTTVLPLARKYWTDVNNVKGGRLPLEHDHYLKAYALTNPKINAEVIYLDEGQDSNPVVADLVQKQKHAQQIVVGDGCQQMFAWRGAVDALATWPNAQQLFLTQSWRFGQAIAEEANRWLAQLDTPMRLSGNPGIESEVRGIEGTPDAVLCRTNGGAMGSVMSLLASGLKVALVGGGDALAKLAEAAAELMAGKRTWHPELAAFTSWTAVREHADEEQSSLRTLVKLIDDNGPEAIIEATSRLVREDQADVTVSTAHKSKGAEWDTVRLAGDFFLPKGGEQMAPAEIMVCYVAVTRAKKALDRTALSD